MLVWTSCSGENTKTGRRGVHDDVHIINKKDHSACNSILTSA